MSLSPETVAVMDEVIALQRDFHAHPELSAHEVRTAGIVAERLTAMGLQPQTGVADTGVVALIEGGAGDGPTVLLRADMDALPIEEECDIPHRSQNPGVMHACGHDGHTAILLGVAKVLTQRAKHLRGRVKLVFQPAEEDTSGAARMLEAGVLESPDVDYAFGLHLWAPHPTGTVSVGSGPVMAASDVFEITIEGCGGHAALPHETRDPVLIGAHLVTALQSIVSRNVPTYDTAVVSVCQFHAGDLFNVIPHTAWLNGTVRTFNPAVQDTIEERFTALVHGVTSSFGASAKLRYVRACFPVVNDPHMAQVVREAAARVVGESRVRPVEPVMGGEDFAYFLRAVPGCFFFVGIRNEAKGTGAPHHNPRFMLDDDALGIGIETFLSVVDRMLGPGA